MFGMSFAEIIIIAVIAVIFLGPDKLPDAMVKFARFFKLVKQTVNTAKSSFESEVKIAELREDAKKYRENIDSTVKGVRKKLTFDELDELKKTATNTENSIKESFSDIKKDILSENKKEKNEALDNLATNTSKEEKIQEKAEEK